MTMITAEKHTDGRVDARPAIRIRSSETAAPAALRRGFWARVFDSIVDARMRRVEDALRLRRRLIADLHARHGFEATYEKTDQPLLAKRAPDRPSRSQNRDIHPRNRKYDMP